MTSPVYQKKIDAQVSTPGKARWIYYTGIKEGDAKTAAFVRIEYPK